MGRNPATFEKRRKEQERVENQKEKAKRKAERRESESSRVRPTSGDPDIDWIVPGPQPASDEPPPDES